MGAYNFDVVQLYEAANPMGANEVSTTMKNVGWNGGLWVCYTSMTSYSDAGNIRVRRAVDKASPNNPIGFILRGSQEASDQYTSQWPGRTGVISIFNQGQFLFKYFETLNKAERDIPGSGAPLVYALNQSLFVSSNGLLTNENETGTARVVAICAGLPAQNNGYMGADVLFP